MLNLQKMKKVKIIITGIFILLLSSGIIAQGGPPPPPGGGHGDPGDNPPAGAALGGGVFVLLGLGAVFGGKKVYDLVKHRKED